MFDPSYSCYKNPQQKENIWAETEHQLDDDGDFLKICHIKLNVHRVYTGIRNSNLMLLEIILMPSTSIMYTSY